MPLIVLSRVVAIVLAAVIDVAAIAAAQTAGQVITGVAVDTTGAVLPGAQVVLTPAGSTTAAQTVVSDGAGVFRLPSVAPGRYDVTVSFEGFTPTTVQVTVGNRAPSPLRVTLPLAGVQQDVVVSNQATTVGTDAATNSDAVTLDQDELASLPVFDQDYIDTVSRFLDSSSIGTGGVTVVVNGMEVSALPVSSSAVQQIKINQDPYSAEYARPGRGRIEIVTKTGAQSFHGEANAIVRDANFDARNAFATTKPEEHRRILEGALGGPIGGAGKTSFLLSGHRRVNDQQAIVFAVGPQGTINDAVLQPNRESLLAFNVTRQQSDRVNVSIRGNWEYESDRNRGVGGTTLASAGTNSEQNEQQVTYRQQTILRPTLLHQVQLLIGHEREPTTSVSAEPGIVVSGGFTGGGAQSLLTRTETHMQLATSLMWTKNNHFVQAGFQLPDWSRRGFFDRSLFGGIFSFASVDAYSRGVPYSFVQQHGDGDVVFLEKQVAAYVKDDWQVRPGVTASFGVRYDWQNYFHDTNNVAPRASLAYAPGNNRATVIRVGAGIFNDRSGPTVIADLLHSQPGGLVRDVITDPSYPNPFASASATTQPPSIVRLAPDVRIPQTLQFSAGVDHQLRKATTLSITYTGSSGYHMFRSRDVNAPPPPLYLDRPDPTYGVVRQIDADGKQRSHSLQVTLRSRIRRWFNGQMQYTFGHARNDTNGIGSYPANDYTLSGEWARADFDRAHRFLLLGRISPGKIADIGVGLTLNSAGPYTETLGGDPFNNGRGHARPPGVARNTLEAGDYASVDLRVSRELRLSAAHSERVMTIAVDAFNVLNRVNYGSYVGVLGSPLFGSPVTARSARQLQLSARLRF